MSSEVLIHIRRGAEFLVAHRAPGHGEYWHAIAGGVNDGEEWEAAAIRELWEETGLKVARLAPIGEFTYVREEWEAKSGMAIEVHAFLVDVAAGWEPLLDHEHDEYRWLPRDEAAALLYWPEPAQLLRALP